MKYRKMISHRSEIIAFAIFSSFFILSVLIIGTLPNDEIHYHLPNVLNFYVNGLDAIFNSEYSAANTPLPYIIVSLIAKLTSPTLLVARTITFIISLLTLFVIIRLMEMYGINKQLIFVFLFYPYFFFNSFVFYTINYGLLFALLSLLFLKDADENLPLGSKLIVGILLAAAVLAQQFYLVMPLAIVFSLFIFSIKQNEGRLLLVIKKTVFPNLVILLPLIIPFFIFIKWGGLTHPNFRVHSISFYPSTIVAILFVTGFYLLPFILQLRNQLSKTKIFYSILASTVLVIIFRPIFSHNQGPGVFTGITHHLITILGKIHPLLSTVVMVALVSSGILILFELYKQLTIQREKILFAICMFLATAYSFNTLIGEKHLIGYIIILFFIVLSRIPKTMSKIYSISMSILGVFYFFYMALFKF